MKLALLLYGSIDNPNNIPSAWPSETLSLTTEQEEQVQDGYFTHNGNDWLVLTQEEYEQHISDNRPAYDAWYANYQTTALAPTMEKIVHDKIKAAMTFGNQMMLDFAVENVLLGITQAGKVGTVTDYLHKLSHYVITGSLYQAIAEIDTLIANGISETYSPFVTEERLLTYKAKIQAFLA